MISELTDASNETLYTTTVRPGSIRGTVMPGIASLQELQRPLGGKSLSTLLKAQDLFAAGKPEKASELLRAIVKDPVAEPWANSMLAAELLRKQEFDSAIPLLEGVVLQLPAIAANHSNLAYAFLVRGRNEEALKEARKAVQLDPGRARYRFVLGQVLLGLGQRDEAEFHLRKAAVEIASAGVMLVRNFGPQ